MPLGSNYLMDALPGGNVNNAADEIVDNLEVPDLDPRFFQNPNFGEMNGDEDILGGIRDPNQIRGPESLSSMHNSKSFGEESDEDADVFK
jgi:hypothetical protein